MGRRRPPSRRVPTVIDTVEPDGSAVFGVNDRTVSCSAQATVPGMDLPRTETEKDWAVLRRSIGIVKRTERVASRATPAAPGRGRNRTTAGALAVRTARTTGSSGRPSASRTPATVSR